MSKEFFAYLVPFGLLLYPLMSPLQCNEYLGKNLYGFSEDHTHSKNYIYILMKQKLDHLHVKILLSTLQCHK